MILQSGDWADPWLFLTFIKKRDAGSWEKLAEGKTIKLSLPEIVALHTVVAGEKPEWKTFHKNNDSGTPIFAHLESSKEDKGISTVVIKAGEYVRPITYPETVILEKLLAHVFEEKIAYATGNNKPAPEEAPQDEPTVEVSEQPVLESPAVEVKDQTHKVQPKSQPPVMDADATLAETFAAFKFDPLPQRLPNGTFPLKGHLKSVRKENGNITLFLKLESGTIKEIAGTDIVGAALHGTEVDLVIKINSSPKALEPAAASPSPKAKPAAKRGKGGKTPENPVNVPEASETTTTPSEKSLILAKSVKAVTDRAVLVTKEGGAELWIPKSALTDNVPAPAAPQDAAWQFTVKSWFAQKPDFLNWVKST